MWVIVQEIGGYAWHKVADLPATREEGNQTFVSDDGTKHKFFMVSHGAGAAGWTLCVEPVLA